MASQTSIQSGAGVSAAAAAAAVTNAQAAPAKGSPAQQLSRDLLVRVFSLLSPGDAVRALPACKQWCLSEYDSISKARAPKLRFFYDHQQVPLVPSKQEQMLWKTFCEVYSVKEPQPQPKSAAAAAAEPQTNSAAAAAAGETAAKKEAEQAIDYRLRFCNFEHRLGLPVRRDGSGFGGADLTNSRSEWYVHVRVTCRSTDQAYWDYLNSRSEGVQEPKLYFNPIFDDFPDRVPLALFINRSGNYKGAGEEITFYHKGQKVVFRCSAGLAQGISALVDRNNYYAAGGDQTIDLEREKARGAILDQLPVGIGPAFTPEQAAAALAAAGVVSQQAYFKVTFDQESEHIFQAWLPPHVSYEQAQALNLTGPNIELFPEDNAEAATATAAAGAAAEGSAAAQSASAAAAKGA